METGSGTLSPLPDVLARGLIPVATLGFLSFFCSTSLFVYLTCRLLSWRQKYGLRTPINQFLFLIYNLVFADIQQATGFLLNIRALRSNAIEVGTPLCFAQGWFISTGDLASSIFISAIAVHTFLGVVMEYRLPSVTFYCCIAVLWTFVYGVTLIGPLLHRADFYVRASAWCWINDSYAIDRLWLHYFWIFICMFGTVLIYGGIFVVLRTRSRSQTLSSQAVHGAMPLMILYPLIYVVCTAPLAIGRIAGLAGKDISLGFFCVAGSMIACNGWLDVLIYTSTRADIVFAAYPPTENIGLDTFAFMGKGHMFGTTTTVEGGERGGSRSGGVRRSHSGDSLEHLYGLDQIRIKGEVTVSVNDGGSEIPKNRREGENKWDGTSRKSSQTLG